MNDFLNTIKKRAKVNPKRIVFPEGNEPRVVEAAKQIESEGIAIPILLKEKPEEHQNFTAYTAKYQKLREVTKEEAVTEVKKPCTFATMMVQTGDADGMIAGPTASSQDRIIPALRIIRAKTKSNKVSGIFFMLLPDDTNEDAANGGILLFADCAVIIDPTAEELADIAIDSAETAKHFGIDPKIAMLSFSTGGSTSDAHVDKVRKATELVKERRPELEIEGEIQVDAALMDDIAARKLPGSKIAGHANVLIFPDLEAGNIGYKLVERLADAKAIGPILQGLNKPVNEVSRGCEAEDIVNLAAITSCQ
jgi:phosphate acetyltransferase